MRTRNLFKAFGLVAIASMLMTSCTSPKPTPTPEPEPDMAETTAIRFHYRRKDHDGTLDPYSKWTIWSWDTANGGNGDRYPFESLDSYGAVCDIELSKVAKDGVFTSQIGFIVSTVNWTKDVSEDRYVNVKTEAPGGIQHVYLYQGKSNVYEDATSPFLDTMGYAKVDSLSQLTVTFKPNDNSFVFDQGKLSVYVNGNKVSNYTVSAYAGKKIYIYFNSPFQISDALQVKYAFTKDYVETKDVAFSSYFDSEEFTSAYVYEGNDLGVTFDDENHPTKTTFKVWAPTSRKIMLNVYSSGNAGAKDKIFEQEMTRGEKGVYSYTANEDLDGKYYTFTVENSKGTNEVVDPYAKSAGMNGQRGMIVNFTKLNNELEGWNADTRPTWGSNNYGSEAIIYEIHVRDMTINPNSGVSAAKRGKFLGLTEENTTYTDGETTVSTGLDHLAELGITHVQIQPFYDYSSVDESKDTSEMSETNYNWGYDPQNYNVLEGSYSTNPSDGKARIIEFKQMVMAMHKKGLNINMDVVYNHTSGFDTSNLQKLVPNYYYRTSVSGTPGNGSGCGNEIASNRVMVNKFIRESVTFYTSEYHLSGYRFDLMGLMDNQVMIDVYNDNKAIYNDIMVYGEPWTGGDTTLEGTYSENNLSNQKTVQTSLSKSFFVGNDVLVGAFNDNIRNAIKGDNAPGKGWVNGQNYSSAIADGIKGMFRASESAISPSQVLNYVSCHDNYTLFDHLTINSRGTTRIVKDEYTQSEAIVMMAFGVAFMQEGEDFMRSKDTGKVNDDGDPIYEHNSYNVGDFINNMDYSLKAKNTDMFEYFKDLIALRKSISGLSVNTRAEVNANIAGYTGANASVRYEIKSGSNTYLVIHAVNAGSFNFSSDYQLVLNSMIGDDLIIDPSGTTLKANQTIVLKK